MKGEGFLASVWLTEATLPKGVTRANAGSWLRGLVDKDYGKCPCFKNSGKNCYDSDPTLIGCLGIRQGDDHYTYDFPPPVGWHLELDGETVPFLEEAYLGVKALVRALKTDTDIATCRYWRLGDWKLVRNS